MTVKPSKLNTAHHIAVAPSRVLPLYPIHKMRRTVLLLILMAPVLLMAQFNFNGITAVYEKQQDMLTQADALFFNGDSKKACGMYNGIFSDHKSNWKYAIRQIRCRSLEEKPSPQMVEFLYSAGIAKSAINADTVLGPYFNGVLTNMPENPFVTDAYNRLLDSLNTADQEARRFDVPLSEMCRVDSLNYTMLNHVFSQTGKKYISSAGSLFILIHSLYQHPMDMPYIIDLLNQALLDGDINPQPYAVVIDEAFIGLFGCVSFGVIEGADGPLPTCAGDQVARLYRTRLLGK